MKSLSGIILNPYILPVLPTILLVAILPFSFNKYNLDIVEYYQEQNGIYNYFDDLTNDGYSEQIRIIDRDDGLVNVTVSDFNGNLFYQWNFRGSTGLFRYTNSEIITGDYNNDGVKSICFFTHSNDSIYLHILEDIRIPEKGVENRFIAEVGPGFQSSFVRVIAGEMEDLNGDGSKEIIFALVAGFPRYPRNVFAYSASSDTLLRSPESYYKFRSFSQADISGNGKREIIINGVSTANVAPYEHKYHDHSNWLILLDNNLDFLFEPVEFPGEARFLYPKLIESNGSSLIAAFEFTPFNNNPSVVHYFDIRGTLTGTRELSISPRNMGYIKDGDDMIFAFDNRPEGTYIYKNNIENRSVFPELRLRKINMRDINNNGSKEIFIPNPLQARVYMFHSDMSRPAVAEINTNLNSRIREQVSFIEQPGEPTLISYQADNDRYVLRYGPNPGFYMGFLYIAGIYAGLLGFSLLTRMVQIKQIEKREKIETMIGELQLSLVKNQLNPHFSMNAINSAIQSIKRNEAEKAADYLARFSRLHRIVLMSAKSVFRTLEDEVGFCQDYIAIERLRFDKSFEAEINIAPGVDLKRRVPKMLIQVYAENAIKHGLSQKDSGGLLTINIGQSDHEITVSIRDNGVGRNASNEKSQFSTGKGMEIMQEYFTLYSDLYNDKIYWEIEDLFDNNGKAAGTEVRIRIYYDK